MSASEVIELSSDEAAPPVEPARAAASGAGPLSPENAAPRPENAAPQPDLVNKLFSNHDLITGAIGRDSITKTALRSLSASVLRTLAVDVLVPGAETLKKPELIEAIFAVADDEHIHRDPAAWTTGLLPPSPTGAVKAEAALAAPPLAAAATAAPAPSDGGGSGERGERPLAGESCGADCGDMPVAERDTTQQEEMEAVGGVVLGAARGGATPLAQAQLTAQSGISMAGGGALPPEQEDKVSAPEGTAQVAPSQAVLSAADSAALTAAAGSEGGAVAAPAESAAGPGARPPTACGGAASTEGGVIVRSAATLETADSGRTPPKSFENDAHGTAAAAAASVHMLAASVGAAPVAQADQSSVQPGQMPLQLAEETSAAPGPAMQLANRTAPPALSVAGAGPGVAAITRETPEGASQALRHAEEAPFTTENTTSPNGRRAVDTAASGAAAGASNAARAPQQAETQFSDVPVATPPPHQQESVAADTPAADTSPQGSSAKGSPAEGSADAASPAARREEHEAGASAGDANGSARNMPEDAEEAAEGAARGAVKGTTAVTNGSPAPFGDETCRHGARGMATQADHAGGAASPREQAAQDDGQTAVGEGAGVHADADTEHGASGRTEKGNDGAFSGTDGAASPAQAHGHGAAAATINEDATNAQHQNGVDGVREDTGDAGDDAEEGGAANALEDTRQAAGDEGRDGDSHARDDATMRLSAIEQGGDGDMVDASIAGAGDSEQGGDALHAQARQAASALGEAERSPTQAGAAVLEAAARNDVEGGAAVPATGDHADEESGAAGLAAAKQGGEEEGAVKQDDGRLSLSSAAEDNNDEAAAPGKREQALASAVAAPAAAQPVPYDDDYSEENEQDAEMGEDEAEEGAPVATTAAAAAAAAVTPATSPAPTAAATPASTPRDARPSAKKAPIVWPEEGGVAKEEKKAENPPVATKAPVASPAKLKPAKGLFDDVLAVRPQSRSGERGADEGSRAPAYRGPGLTVAIRANHAGSFGTAGRTVPRDVHLDRGGRSLNVAAAEGLPGASQRGRLELSGDKHRELPPRAKRTIEFLGGLAAEKDPDYAKHAARVKVTVADVAAPLWHGEAARKKWVVDPLEWDRAYKHGVACIEASLRLDPSLWNMDWIRANTTRRVRATCVRKIPTNLPPSAAKTTYYRHFKALCRAEQGPAPVTAAMRKAGEADYERGCARMTAAFQADTFHTLLKLHPAVKYKVLVALGAEVLTPRFAAAASAVDARLRELVRLHCPPGSVGHVLRGLRGRADEAAGGHRGDGAREADDLRHSKRASETPSRRAGGSRSGEDLRRTPPPEGVRGVSVGASRPSEATPGSRARHAPERDAASERHAHDARGDYKRPEKRERSPHGRFIQREAAPPSAAADGGRYRAPHDRYARVEAAPEPLSPRGDAGVRRRKVWDEPTGKPYAAPRAGGYQQPAALPRPRSGGFMRTLAEPASPPSARHRAAPQREPAWDAPPPHTRGYQGSHSHSLDVDLVPARAPLPLPPASAQPVPAPAPAPALVAAAAPPIALSATDLAALVKSTVETSLKELTARHSAALAPSGTPSGTGGGPDISQMVSSIMSEVQAGRAAPATPPATTFAPAAPTHDDYADGRKRARDDPYGDDLRPRYGGDDLAYGGYGRHAPQGVQTRHHPPHHAPPRELAAASLQPPPDVLDAYAAPPRRARLATPPAVQEVLDAHAPRGAAPYATRGHSRHASPDVEIVGMSRQAVDARYAPSRDAPVATSARAPAPYPLPADTSHYDARYRDEARRPAEQQYAPPPARAERRTFRDAPPVETGDRSVYASQRDDGRAPPARYYDDHLAPRPSDYPPPADSGRYDSASVYDSVIDTASAPAEPRPRGFAPASAYDPRAGPESYAPRAYADAYPERGAEVRAAAWEDHRRVEAFGAERTERHRAVERSLRRTSPQPVIEVPPAAGAAGYGRRRDVVEDDARAAPRSLERAAARSPPRHADPPRSTRPPEAERRVPRAHVEDRAEARPRFPSPHARSRTPDRRRHHRSPSPRRRDAPERRRRSRTPPAAAAAAAAAPILKLRSGGSRVADRRRTMPNARPEVRENEDAFAVEYCCFAVADGFEGKASPTCPAFSSAAFAQELVNGATQLAAHEVAAHVAARGRGPPLTPPVLTLQRAANAVRASGAAAVLLGTVDPLSGVLSVGKLGDVGYVVLRPPPPGSRADADGDLQVVSGWRPYDPHDHSRAFYGTLITASNDLVNAVPVASWRHDPTAAEIRLQPSDVVIAATDGFFDAVHVTGPEGAATRAFVRAAYLEKQLDPGQLAEQLLLRAWNAVQGAKGRALRDIDTPFCREAERVGCQGKFPFMPQDDIAVVVSYVLDPS